MNEINSIPSPPQPEKKDTVTFNKKNLAIIFLGLAITILTLVILIPSGSTSKDSSSETTPPAPIVTNPPYTVPPAPVTNKYDDYMNYVLNNSGKANTWSKSEIIEFGDLVCQALDNGNSVRSVVNLLNGYAKTTSDAELFASVMIGSIQHLCPEYKSDLNYYLNS